MAIATKTAAGTLESLLGDDAASLLGHTCKTVGKEHLHLPGPDFVDRVWAQSDRPTRVLRSLETLYAHGRLGGTGYLSILPVDQGIEHSGGASFAPNPAYFDGEKLVELAVEGGCNAVASTSPRWRPCSPRYDASFDKATANVSGFCIMPIQP
jgi:class I fructose-bisphosphate aldolase